jgi:hypothetical protein
VGLACLVMVILKSGLPRSVQAQRREFRNGADGPETDVSVRAVLPSLAHPPPTTKTSAVRRAPAASDIANRLGPIQ